MQLYRQHVHLRLWRTDGQVTKWGGVIRWARWIHFVTQYSLYVCTFSRLLWWCWPAMKRREKETWIVKKYWYDVKKRTLYVSIDKEGIPFEWQLLDDEGTKLKIRFWRRDNNDAVDGNLLEFPPALIIIFIKRSITIAKQNLYFFSTGSKEKVLLCYRNIDELSNLWSHLWARGHLAMNSSFHEVF